MVPRHIKTVLRVRPVKVEVGALSLAVKNDTTVMTTNPAGRLRGGGSSGSRMYTYGKVMDESTSQVTWLVRFRFLMRILYVYTV